MDNASNNLTLIKHLKDYFHEHYPANGFSANWNQIKCKFRILDLAAKEIWDFHQNAAVFPLIGTNAIVSK